MAVQYIIIGDFVHCPQCDHWGAEHDGGILAPMKCHHMNQVEGEDVECPCVLDGEEFQTLVEEEPETPATPPDQP